MHEKDEILGNYLLVYLQFLLWLWTSGYEINCITIYLINIDNPFGKKYKCTLFQSLTSG